jgi:hypothetical protein
LADGVQLRGWAAEDATRIDGYEKWLDASAAGKEQTRSMARKVIMTITSPLNDGKKSNDSVKYPVVRENF